MTRKHTLPAGATEKRRVAEQLIAWHFEAEPRLQEVYLINFTDSPSTAIKLLEVNGATISTGRVEPFGFAATDEIPFPTLIAEITPDELKEFTRDPRKLPRGWALAPRLRKPLMARFFVECDAGG